MLGNLKAITIAVPDLDVAIHYYQDVLGMFVSSPQDLPDQDLRLAVVKLPNTLLELITPLSETSPLQGFLKENPKGAVFHLSFEVADLNKAKDKLTALKGNGEEILELQQGYHGNPVLQIEATSTGGVALTLEQVALHPTIDRIDIGRIGPAHTRQRPASGSLEGVGGIEMSLEVGFASPTPKDNLEGE